jgi:hypothetical protein
VSSGELEFGSDSFLDIIANIVGILIILIVVAGVKVARQPAEVPVVAETQGTELPATPDAVSEVTANVQPQELIEDTQPKADLADDGGRQAAAREIELLTEESALYAEQVQELDAQISGLQLSIEHSDAQMAGLKNLMTDLQQKEESARVRGELISARLKQVQGERATTTGRVLSLSQNLAELEGRVQARDAALKSSDRHKEFLADRLEEVGQLTQQLQEVLEEHQPEDEDRERIQHRLSPVGQVVSDEELHFRLSRGRIAFIPLEPLLERLKAQVSARRTTVLRLSRYEGVVGPVGGFRMEYTVERSPLPPLQELQHGAGAWRISVSRWTLQPAETLEAESVADALIVGSRFRQVLETAALDSTVTIWLYPDDFAAFREIRELVHGLQLRIAARPLPDGIPISGSPRGSQSSGQ